MANIGDEELFTSSDNTDIANNIMTSLVEDYPFVDISEWDLTPTSESGLIDAGRAYDRDELMGDLLMRERFVGSALDIGAFERQ